MVDTTYCITWKFFVTWQCPSVCSSYCITWKFFVQRFPSVCSSSCITRKFNVLNVAMSSLVCPFIESRGRSFHTHLQFIELQIPKRSQWLSVINALVNLYGPSSLQTTCRQCQGGQVQSDKLGTENGYRGPPSYRCNSHVPLTRSMATQIMTAIKRAEVSQFYQLDHLESDFTPYWVK